MAIEFRCGNCNKLLRVSDEAAGKRAKCPGCATVLTVPAVSTAASSVLPPATPIPPPEPPPPAPPPSAPAPPPEPPPVAPPPADEYGMSEELPPSIPIPERYANRPVESPSASQAKSAAQAAPAGAVDPATILKRTFEIFKSRPGPCLMMGIIPNLIVLGLAIGLALIAAAISAVTKSPWLGRIVQAPGNLVIFVIAGWFLAMQVRAFLKIARGQEPRLGDLFAYDPSLLPAMGAAIVLNLIVSIGCSICAFPGPFIMSMFFAAVPLILERGVGLVDALAQSVQMTNSNRMPLFLTWLAAMAGGLLLSLFTCGLGALVVGPFLMLLTAVLYLTLTGEQTVEPLR